MPLEILSPELISEHSPSLASWYWRIVSLCGRMTHKHTFVWGGTFFPKRINRAEAMDPKILPSLQQTRPYAVV